MNKYDKELKRARTAAGAARAADAVWAARAASAADAARGARAAMAASDEELEAQIKMTLGVLNEQRKPTATSRPPREECKPRAV